MSTQKPSTIKIGLKQAERLCPLLKCVERMVKQHVASDIKPKTFGPLKKGATLYN